METNYKTNLISANAALYNLMIRGMELWASTQVSITAQPDVDRARVSLAVTAGYEAMANSLDLDGQK